MRAPEVAVNDLGEKRQAIPEDHPVMLAFRNAPLDDEPMTEAEMVALEEWRASPVGTDGAAVSAMAPRQVYLVDSMPRTHLGKIDRSRLRKG